MKVDQTELSFLHQIHTDHVFRITGVDAPYSLVVAHKGHIVSLQDEILETLQHGKIPPLTRTLALLLYTLAKRLLHRHSLKQSFIADSTLFSTQSVLSIHSMTRFIPCKALTDIANPLPTAWWFIFVLSKSRLSLGHERHLGVQHPGSGRGSSCPSNCSRWGKGQPGRPRHRWCRAFSPTGNSAGRSPWTWSGWTTAPGSAALGWAAQEAATVDNTFRRKKVDRRSLWYWGR